MVFLTWSTLGSPLKCPAIGRIQSPLVAVHYWLKPFFLSLAPASNSSVRLLKYDEANKQHLAAFELKFDDGSHQFFAVLLSAKLVVLKFIFTNDLEDIRRTLGFQSLSLNDGFLCENLKDNFFLFLQANNYLNSSEDFIQSALVSSMARAQPAPQVQANTQVSGQANQQAADLQPKAIPMDPRQQPTNQDQTAGQSNLSLLVNQIQYADQRPVPYMPNMPNSPPNIRLPDSINKQSQQQIIQNASHQVNNLPPQQPPSAQQPQNQQAAQTQGAAQEQMNLPGLEGLDPEVIQLILRGANLQQEGGQSHGAQQPEGSGPNGILTPQTNLSLIPNGSQQNAQNLPNMQNQNQGGNQDNLNYEALMQLYAQQNAAYAQQNQAGPYSIPPQADQNGNFYAPGFQGTADSSIAQGSQQGQQIQQSQQSQQGGYYGNQNVINQEQNHPIAASQMTQQQDLSTMQTQIDAGQSRVSFQSKVDSNQRGPLTTSPNSAYSVYEVPIPQAGVAKKPTQIDLPSVGATIQSSSVTTGAQPPPATAASKSSLLRTQNTVRGPEISKVAVTTSKNTISIGDVIKGTKVDATKKPVASARTEYSEPRF